MQGFSKDDEGLLGEVGLPTQGILRLPGPTHEAAKVVRKLLQTNHVKYDWQFNDEGFHNHLSHAILAAFSLGASSDMIQETYDLHSRIQKPMCTLRRKVNYQNWTRWLGQSEYYSSYLVFFTEEISKYGAAATIERYLFKYKEGQMLIRSVSGAIHPLIQIGHGVEFSLDALVAEGLAQACVHSAAVEGLFNDGWPHETPSTGSNSAPSAFASAFSHFKSLKVPVPATFGSSKESFPATLLRLNPVRPRHPRLGLSAFTIISHILKDPRLAAGQANRKDDFPRLESAIRNRGELIRAWCSEWIVDPSGGWTEIVEKTEEIFWVASVLVGASSRPGYKPRMDFFMMHALTSAMFLPSLLEVLSPTSRIQLLHSHFRVMIGYWISRGRPFLYIQETLMAANPLPCAPNLNTQEESAIRRGLDKARAEERAKESTKASPEHSPDGEAKRTEFASSVDQTTSKSEANTMNEDGHVDVSLDTPPTDKEVNPMDEVTPSFQHTQLTQEDEEASEGFRTPTQSNGDGHAFASRSTSPLDKASESDRQAASSSASWSDIVTAAIDHTDEHVTKMIRSLVFAAQNFGMTPAGAYRSALPGTEKLDGTVFVRLAGLLLKSMGWEHFGEAAGDWDRSVLGFDEAWQDETREIVAYTAEEKGKGRATQDLDSRLQSYQIGGNNRSRSNTIFETRMNYPRYQDKGKGRTSPNGNDVYDVEESEQEKLQRKYYEDDETDPNAFGEHQQWAEGVV